MEVEIDFRKTPQKNAEKYFEESKKARKKLDAAERAIKETLKKIDEVRLKEEKKAEKPLKRVRGKWFNKFHWCITSDDFLVIAGRDATQNDMIFKKHIEPGDIVLHADIQGAPLTVVKSEGKATTPSALKEAGEIAASYSSAWKHGLGSVDVYWVNPNQVSKTAESGEFLPKGSFMIRGRKVYLRKIPLRIAVGIKIERGEQITAVVIAGGLESISKHARYFTTIVPGSLEQGAAAQEVKKRLIYKAQPDDKSLIENVELDEIRKNIPSGKSDVV